MRQVLDQGVDVVTFTSSSTVRNLADALDGEISRLNSSVVACIGPATAATAEELGLNVDLVANQHTVEGLAEALTLYYGAPEELDSACAKTMRTTGGLKNA